MSEWVSEWVTRSPIELIWTAKNHWPFHRWQWWAAKPFIQWQWYSYTKTIETPLTTMLLWQKPLTIPSCSKFCHCYGLEAREKFKRFAARFKRCHTLLLSSALPCSWYKGWEWDEGFSQYQMLSWHKQSKPWTNNLTILTVFCIVSLASASSNQMIWKQSSGKPFLAITFLSLVTLGYSTYPTEVNK